MSDGRHHFEVVSSQQRFAGAVFEVRTDAVRMPDGSVADRDIIRHPGAVGILALDELDLTPLQQVMRTTYNPDFLVPGPQDPNPNFADCSAIASWPTSPASQPNDTLQETSSARCRLIGLPPHVLPPWLGSL